jgi:hypothetical protein
MNNCHFECSKTVRSKVKSGKPLLYSEIGFGFCSLVLPIRTKSEANCSEHWTKKHKRHKQQQRLVYLALNPFKCQIKLPCQITLTRYAPKTLDKHDNLPMSLKWIVDAFCAILTGDLRPGRADDDNRITIAYNQVKDPHYYVKIFITF